jgi:hypothetical protein
MKEIESPVVFDINAALAETAAAEAEKTAFRPPLHVHTDIEPTLSRVRRNSISGDTLEAIRQDWLRTVAELEKRFDTHRKRLDSHCTGLRSLIDDLRQLGG